MTATLWEVFHQAGCSILKTMSRTFRDFGLFTVTVKNYLSEWEHANAMWLMSFYIFVCLRCRVSVGNWSTKTCLMRLQCSSIVLLSWVIKHHWRTIIGPSLLFLTAHSICRPIGKWSAFVSEVFDIDRWCSSILQYSVSSFTSGESDFCHQRVSLLSRSRGFDAFQISFY